MTEKIISELSDYLIFFAGIIVVFGSLFAMYYFTICRELGLAEGCRRLVQGPTEEDFKKLQESGVYI